MKHTKGPWTVKGEGENSIVFIKQGLCFQAQCILNLDENHEEIQANAKLISAAPEMLEALELAFKLLPPSEDGGPMLEKIESAIRKAKGL